MYFRLLLSDRRKERHVNTQLNIKTRRPLFRPNVVTLLIGVVVLLVLGAPSAKAQTTTDATATDSAVVDSSITISAKGTVNDPSGAITVSGSVIVSSRRVIDSTLAASTPIVVLDLDFSRLKGTSGTLKTLKVYVTGDNHATEIRPLQASDTIIVTCPYFESTKDGLSARTMLVTATLNFDISTGKVTSGSIAIGNNVVTSSMVATTTM
jgi:hypothetical protein